MAFARTCFRCGTRWPEGEPPRYHDRCSGCGQSLHSCRHCRAFEWDGRRGVCISPTADPPRDSTAQNYCDEFDFVGAVPESPDLKGATPERGKGRDAFRKLFGE
ncbi:MAG TPA: hypothetical protein VFI25_11565 [Planctomycetota bacterium]|nr:hypothetical protein [Planctomycetota bacterium]